MLNNAKKLFYSIFNSKFCQRYSFKIIFIQIVAKTLAIQSLAHSKNSPFKIYKIIIYVNLVLLCKAKTKQNTYVH